MLGCLILVLNKFALIEGSSLLRLGIHINISVNIRVQVLVEFLR